VAREVPALAIDDDVGELGVEMLARRQRRLDLARICAARTRHARAVARDQPLRIADLGIDLGLATCPYGAVSECASNQSTNFASSTAPTVAVGKRDREALGDAAGPFAVRRLRQIVEGRTKRIEAHRRRTYHPDR